MNIDKRLYKWDQRQNEQLFNAELHIFPFLLISLSFPRKLVIFYLFTHISVPIDAETAKTNVVPEKDEKIEKEKFK